MTEAQLSLEILPKREESNTITLSDLIVRVRGQNEQRHYGHVSRLYKPLPLFSNDVQLLQLRTTCSET